MASVTKNTDDEKSMADDDLPRDSEEPKGEKPKGDKPQPLAYSRKEPAGPGYFTIYKSGQGYWTRIGTLAGALLIGVFTSANIYNLVPTFVSARNGARVAAMSVAIFGALYVWLCWWLLNKAGNVDFLIATDSEMKKVNWTSRKELVGSTKIVVIFMFLVAIFLFTVDQIFQALMYLINVVKIKPFWWW